VSALEGEDLRFPDLVYGCSIQDGASKKDQPMNEKEKQEFYVAMCICCLIAQSMKDCSMCRFNLGLDEQVKPTNLIPVLIPTQVIALTLSE
jgi:hypothetical protein